MKNIDFLLKMSPLSQQDPFLKDIYIDNQKHLNKFKKEILNPKNIHYRSATHLAVFLDTFFQEEDISSIILTTLKQFILLDEKLLEAIKTNETFRMEYIKTRDDYWMTISKNHEPNTKEHINITKTINTMNFYITFLNKTSNLYKIEITQVAFHELLNEKFDETLLNTYKGS